MTERPADAERHERLERAKGLRDEAQEMQRAAEAEPDRERARVLKSNSRWLETVANAEEKHAPAGDEQGPEERSGGSRAVQTPGRARLREACKYLDKLSPRLSPRQSRRLASGSPLSERDLDALGPGLGPPLWLAGEGAHPHGDQG